MNTKRAGGTNSNSGVGFNVTLDAPTVEAKAETSALPSRSAAVSDTSVATPAKASSMPVIIVATSENPCSDPNCGVDQNPRNIGFTTDPMSQRETDALVAGAMKAAGIDPASLPVIDLTNLPTRSSSSVTPAEIQGMVLQLARNLGLSDVPAIALGDLAARGHHYSGGGYVRQKLEDSGYPVNFGALPDFSAGAMENPGLITYRASDLRARHEPAHLVDMAHSPVKDTDMSKTLTGIMARQLERSGFLQNKKVCVLGYGALGKAAVDALLSKGVEVAVYDASKKLDVATLDPRIKVLTAMPGGDIAKLDCSGRKRKPAAEKNTLTLKNLLSAGDGVIPDEQMRVTIAMMLMANFPR